MYKLMLVSIEGKQMSTGIASIGQVWKTRSTANINEILDGTKCSWNL
jgi:hypothetical protein